MANDIIGFLPPFVVNNSNPILPLSETFSWGLNKFKIPDLHDRGITGKGIKIGILDTGVQIDHPDLVIAGSYDMSGNNPSDTVGHGTHVAGIIGARMNDKGVRGVAPDAELYTYKVLPDGSGKIEYIVKGIQKAVEDGMQIINMSLGAASEQDILPLKEACDYAASKGVIIMCAAGNDGREEREQPAAYDSVYAVGSITEALQVSDFSSYGKHLDIVAPGSKIVSTYIGSRYAILSGTSMATPFASGCIALMMQAGVKITYEEVTTSTIDLLDPHWDMTSGYGAISPSIAINRLGAPVQDPGIPKQIIIKHIATIQKALLEISDILK